MLRDALLVLIAVGVVLVIGISLLALRRRFIQRGATFDASLRLRQRRFGQGWALGVARYADDRLEWFRVFSVSIRPRVFPRDELAIGDRREPAYAESLAIMPGHIIVSCKVIGEDLEIALSPEALTGLLAWREAAPPGHHVATG